MKKKRRAKRIGLGRKKNMFSKRPNMSAWSVKKSSSFGSQELEFSPLGIVRKPRPSQVVVKLKAAGLNPCDHQMISGSWLIHKKFPWIAGVDGAGIISELGEDVTNFKKGDRVMFFVDLYGENGTFAEYTVVESHLLTRIPDSISFEYAAVIPCAGYTSYIAINHKLRVGPNDTVLIHSGTGGTGSYAIQFAKAKGARVITTCSQRNVEFVTKNLGADGYILYDDDDFVGKVMEMTNHEGVDMVYNTYGGSTSSRDFEIIKNNGHIAFIAGRPDWDKVEEYTRSISLHEVYLGSVFEKSNFSNKGSEKERIRQQSKLARIGEDILELVVQKKVKSYIAELFPLDRLKQALGLVASRNGVKPGKIVIKM